MMSRDEKRSMQRVAKQVGLTTSDVIRTAVNEFVKKTNGTAAVLGAIALMAVFGLVWVVVTG